MQELLDTFPSPINLPVCQWKAVLMEELTMRKGWGRWQLAGNDHPLNSTCRRRCKEEPDHINGTYWIQM